MKYILLLIILFVSLSLEKKRSFELLQNEVKYRISLVSKSLPIKLKYFVTHCILARKKKNYVLRGAFNMKIDI